MKKLVLFSLIFIGVTVFSAAQTATGGFIIQEGIASWYGPDFHGRQTASGEIFDMTQYTAAHPTLPFGTMLTITNKQNNRRVTVRVNDRGPFVAARIIDLSRAAAEALDMIGTGTAPVIVESAVSASLGPVSPAAPVASAPPAETPPAVVQAPPVETPAPAVVQAPPVQPAPAVMPTVAAAPVPSASVPSAVSYTAPPAVIKGVIPPAGSTKLYRIQVGAFSVPRNALDVFERLKAAGLSPRYEQYGNLYRVVLAELKAADIPAIAQKLGNSGFQEVLLREES
ncbi:MAG: septal ring lytic transglycosylase RlpA family protein [Treponema sp.]|jgi:rare lipoprotein A|nr:septal ring lytic transglycosylase RlpA family protein [Treponema sp.]